jgi:hypothetical protein
MTLQIYRTARNREGGGNAPPLTTCGPGEPRIAQSTLRNLGRRKVRSESSPRPIIARNQWSIEDAGHWRRGEDRANGRWRRGGRAHVGADPIDSTNLATSREEAAAQWRRRRDYGTRSDEEPLAETGGQSSFFTREKRKRDVTAPCRFTLIHHCYILQSKPSSTPLSRSSTFVPSLTQNVPRFACTGSGPTY